MPDPINLPARTPGHQFAIRYAVILHQYAHRPKHWRYHTVVEARHAAEVMLQAAGFGDTDHAVHAVGSRFLEANPAPPLRPGDHHEADMHAYQRWLDAARQVLGGMLDEMPEPMLTATVRRLRARRTVGADTGGAVPGTSETPTVFDAVAAARNVDPAAIAAELGIPEWELDQVAADVDTFLATFGRFVEAQGGRLRVEARWPDGTSLDLDPEVPSRS